MFSSWLRRIGRILGYGAGSARESPANDSPPDTRPDAAIPAFGVRRLDSRADFVTLFLEPQGSTDGIERALALSHPSGEFSVEGYCWVDRAPVKFAVDYRYAAEAGGRLWPNWRERLVCPLCGLNNRQRAMLHVATDVLRLDPGSRIYLTEQVSAVYRSFSQRFPRIQGSEFLGGGALPGSVDRRGVRHEDVTRLSFARGSFDALLSFDVLEHVPDYRAALSEFFRVLAPGGTLLLTAPFLAESDETRIRASVEADGSIRHHLSPQFHGDPVKPEEGVLCYQEFGWDLLDRLREAGFVDAAVLAFRSPEYGYLGGWQLAFAARKGASGPARVAPASFSARRSGQPDAV